MNLLNRDVEWKNEQGRRKRGYVVGAPEDHYVILGEDDEVHTVAADKCRDIDLDLED